MENITIDALEDTYVRRRGDSVITALFSRRLLEENLEQATLGRLGQEDVGRVVDDVSQRLLEKLRTIAHTLTPDDLRRNDLNEYASAIYDTDIRNEVEAALRTVSDSSAHVLYVLGVRGRVVTSKQRNRNLQQADDGDAPVSFADARQFLAWLFSEGNYPRLIAALPESNGRPEDRWWPAAPAARPRVVLKRRENESLDFSYSKLIASIEHALIGRFDARGRAVLVAQWVLAGLAGQQIVLSTQLSSAVMSALRRLDDIAYLRWAIVAKDLHRVEQIRDEAVDLLRHPSPRLVFDRTAVARALPQTFD